MKKQKAVKNIETVKNILFLWIYDKKFLQTMAEDEAGAVSAKAVVRLRIADNKKFST
jgi:hypothetical protein